MHRCDFVSDFRAAVTFKNRLHRESGEERAEPIPFSTISEVALVFFFQFFMVAVESKLVELIVIF